MVALSRIRLFVIRGETLMHRMPAPGAGAPDPLERMPESRPRLPARPIAGRVGAAGRNVVQRLVVGRGDRRRPRPDLACIERGRTRRGPSAGGREAEHTDQDRDPSQSLPSHRAAHPTRLLTEDRPAGARASRPVSSGRSGTLRNPDPRPVARRKAGEGPGAFAREIGSGAGRRRCS